jgi:hypothetical protein
MTAHTPVAYTPWNLPTDGILEDGDSFNGYYGNQIMELTYSNVNHPDNSVITVEGNGVSIKNLMIYPSTEHCTGIKINPNVINCKIENVFISCNENLRFDTGIEINPVSSSTTNSGHTFNHIQMGSGGFEAVRTGIKLLGTGYFNQMSIVDVGMTLANDSTSSYGFEIGTGSVLNTSRIVANTWFKRGATNACGLYIDGILNNNFIKFTTELEGGGSNGCGVKLGPSASIATPTSNNGNCIYHYKMGFWEDNIPLSNPHNRCANSITWRW